MCKNTNKKMIQFSDIEIEIETVSHDRECFDCGGLAYAETGFIFQDNLYCQDCCPDGYGE